MDEPVGGQAYDNALYRWNHREYEAEDATFESIFEEELFRSIRRQVRKAWITLYVVVSVNILFLALAIMANGYGW